MKKKTNNNIEQITPLEDAELSTSVLNSAHVAPSGKVKGSVVIGRAETGKAEWGSITGDIENQTDLIEYIDDHHDATKQDKLVNRQNIKSVNGQTLLGSGNINITGEPDAYIKSAEIINSGNSLRITNKAGQVSTFTPQTGGGGKIDDVKVNGISVVSNKVANIVSRDLVIDGSNITGTISDGHIASAETWNAKQDGIADLDTIRSGASSGSSAVQPSRTIAGIDLQNDITSSELGGSLNATDIPYNNQTYSTIGAALDELLYVAPAITSFTGGGTYEVGQSISSINFAWTINKTINTQTLTDVGSLDPSLRSYLYTLATPLTSNKTYTLTVADNKKSASSYTTVSFNNKYYCGTLNTPTITNAQILAFTDKSWVYSRQMTRIFNCTGGKYFYIVLPTVLCSGISFKVGGLAFSDMHLETITLTNESGGQVQYNVYRPNNLQTGNAITVEVI